jgi:hypothetical protein
MYGVNEKRIRLLIGRQYRSKGSYNKGLIMAELYQLLPIDFVVKINETTGYLYITRN